jgi:tRNA1(Val) A37 N6-methylase TrmN6
MMETTRDRFLGGRIAVRQPTEGFRAGHDSVLLAAAVPAKAGERVLELGAGAGIAALCLAARVPGLEVTGIELDPELVALANANAAENGMAERLRFVQGDAHAVVADRFDHAFFNPPFHRVSGQVSPSAARDRAKRDVADLVTQWARIALAQVNEGGSVTAIVSAERQAEIVAAAAGSGVTLLPLLPHAGEAPKRVIARMRKGTARPTRTLSGFVLHDREGRNSEAAEAVLRHSAALPLG